MAHFYVVRFNKAMSSRRRRNQPPPKPTWTNHPLVQLWAKRLLSLCIIVFLVTVTYQHYFTFPELEVIPRKFGKLTKVDGTQETNDPSCLKEEECKADPACAKYLKKNPKALETCIKKEDQRLSETNEPQP